MGLPSSLALTKTSLTKALALSVLTGRTSTGGPSARKISCSLSLSLASVRFARSVQLCVCGGGCAADGRVLAMLCGRTFAVLPQLVLFMHLLVLFMHPSPLLFVSFAAFVCHMNVFPVINELVDPAPKRVNLVSKGSVATCAIVFYFAGLMGYWVFGNEFIQCELEERCVHVHVFAHALDFTLAEGVVLGVGFPLSPIALLPLSPAADIIKAYEHLQHGSPDHILVPSGMVRTVQFGIGLALTFSFPVVAYELRHSFEQVRCLEGILHCDILG
jgi:hypothetical protein